MRHCGTGRLAHGDLERRIALDQRSHDRDRPSLRAGRRRGLGRGGRQGGPGPAAGSLLSILPWWRAAYAFGGRPPRSTIIESSKLRSDSDTEVLLEACALWGVEAAIERAIGMFVFALWDRKTRTLVLARDRLEIEGQLQWRWAILVCILAAAVVFKAAKIAIAGSESRAAR